MIDIMLPMPHYRNGGFEVAALPQHMPTPGVSPWTPSLAGLVLAAGLFGEG